MCCLVASGLVAIVYTEHKLWGDGGLFRERVSSVSDGKQQQHQQEQEQEDWDTFDERRIDRGIGLATMYICNAVNAQGVFNYEVKVRKGGEIEHKDTYNVLRHAGAIYSLVDSCYMKGRELFSDEQRSAYCHSAHDKIDATAKWLQRETVEAVPGVGLSAVFKPHRSHKKGNSIDRRLALGAQGLAMVAFVGANEVKPETASFPLLEDVGNFTWKVLQKENGTFFPFYYPFKAPFGPSDQPPSLYYPGEACLGLTYLYKAFKQRAAELPSTSERDERERLEELSDLYLEAAAKGLEGLANERESWRPELIPPDHWALIATAEILPHLPRDRHHKLLKHAASVVKVMHDRDMVRIPFFAELGVSSIATVLEAQFAMLPIFYTHNNNSKQEQEQSSGNGYYDNVEQAWCLAEKTAFLLRQVQAREKPEIMTGGMPHLIYLENKDAQGENVKVDETQMQQMQQMDDTTDRVIHRSIRKDNGRFRIDDTQHTLSAWLSYKKALRGGSGLSQIDCTKVGVPFLVEDLLVQEKKKKKKKPKT
jgi:hypothetical protein